MVKEDGEKMSTSEMPEEPESTTTSNQVSEEPAEQLSIINHGRRFLDEEKQNILFEILRCAVCLEIPKGKHLQVRTCEKGHHFCSPCHKKLHTCAICRGRLFVGRNFVVEELISKLGGDLGITKHTPPPAYIAPQYCPGKFKCLQCKSDVTAGKMLHHLRKVHPNQLIDNKRSNPFNGRFDWMFNFSHQSNDLIWTHALFVSDMGVFSVLIHRVEDVCSCWLQMLADDVVSSNYRYRLAVKFVNSTYAITEQSIHNAVMLSYRVKLDKIPKENVLTFDYSNVLSKTDDVKIVLSIWKNKQEGEKEFPDSTLVGLPDDTVIFNNDRKTRRNRRRNFRRKIVKERFRIINAMENDFSNLTTEDNGSFSNLIKHIFDI